MDIGPNCKNKSRCPEPWKNLIQPSTLFCLLQGTSTWHCRSFHSNAIWNAWPTVTDNFLCCAWLLVPVSLYGTTEMAAKTSAPKIHTEIISHGNHETFLSWRKLWLRTASSETFLLSVCSSSMTDGEGCGMESIMVSYKFWDCYQSDASPRDALDIVLLLFLCIFLLEKESDNGPIWTVA